MANRSSDYERDGFLIIPEMIPPDECAALKVEARRVLREYSSGNHTVYVGAAVVSSLFRRFADDIRIVKVLREIMPQGIAFLSDKIVFKSQEHRFETPWHIDAYYWRGTRPKISVWIALDDVTAENGALKVVPGSHLVEWGVHQSDGAQSNGEFVNVVREKAWKASDEVICEISAGGTVFFSDRLLHASTPNTAGADRYSLISTYHAPSPDEDFDRQFPARHEIFLATPHS